MRLAWLALALGLAPVVATGASAAESPVVVELFTSQGCSSCPPADAFLTDLARQRRDVLPLAFHVTYWDDLGWKDPYSLDAATARQRSYARSLGDGGLYTPQMVVNGTYAFIGSRRNEVLAGIARAAEGQATEIPLRLTRAGQTLMVSIGEGSEHAAVMLVGFDPEHETHVGRGENSGLRLIESNIVRSLTTLGRWEGKSAEFAQPVPQGERFAVLLQADDGRIVAATRLSEPSR